MVEIGIYLGISSLSEERRVAHHAAALQLGIIYMDGVIADYTFKRIDEKRLALKQLKSVKSLILVNVQWVIFLNHV
jgi:hypothetical protein